MEEESELKIDKKTARKMAREQKLMQMRKDTLTREMALDEITLTKIKGKWFDKVLEAKIPEMRDNLRHILHYMEKLIEAENFRELRYEEERQELEDKTTAMKKSHASALETLFEIYQKRVQDMHNAYSGMVSERKTEAEAEFAAINEKEQRNHDNMHTMLYQMHENKEKKEEMMNCDMFLKIDDEISKNTEIQETLRTKLERKMEKKWGEITATLNKYEESTRARKAEYNMLKSKDDADSKIIHQQMKKTQKLFEQLEELKKCLDFCYAPKETISLITDLRDERSRFFNTFTQLKAILDEELEEDNLNLKQLTLATNSIISVVFEVSNLALTRVLASGRALHPSTWPKTILRCLSGYHRYLQAFWFRGDRVAGILDLKNICKKGERILTLFRICRRYETELEKITPVGEYLNFPKSLLAGERKKGHRGHRPDSEDSGLNKNFELYVKDFQVLEKFWRKVAKVRLSKLALTKWVGSLEKENDFLKGILSSYLKEATDKPPQIGLRAYQSC